MLGTFVGVAAAQSPDASPPKSAVPAEAGPQKSSPDKQSSNKVATEAAETPASPGPGDLKQARILADSKRLLQLAQELKVEVAKSNKDVLSFAVVKKADEIEKLAKSLKERMRAE